MSWTKRHILYGLYLISSTLLIVLLVDFAVGAYFLPCSDNHPRTRDRCNTSSRVQHPVYHHDLARNYRGKANWGENIYDLCTDHNSFRISCESSSTMNVDFDIAFIGDSFTEGIGLAYENTFVGQIAAARPDLRIANLGVASYSPSIYYSKVKHLLDNGIKFRSLIVYIDISDIQDEAVSYASIDGVVVDKRLLGSKHATVLQKVKTLAHWSFPLTYFGLHVLSGRYLGRNKRSPERSLDSYSGYRDPRSSWTFNSSSPGYGPGGVIEGVNQSLTAMENLSELLKVKGISLSVAVYPWPAQLLYDKVDSEQVRIWRGFCQNRCVKFFDSFESFFALKNTTPTNRLIDSYFIAGDNHHTRRGAEVLAQDFLVGFEK